MACKRGGDVIVSLDPKLYVIVEDGDGYRWPILRKYLPELLNEYQSVIDNLKGNPLVSEKDLLRMFTIKVDDAER